MMKYSHDHMVIVIRKMYPNAVHGRDFMVAHKLDESGAQDGDPFIVRWNLDAPQPTDDEIKSAYMADASGYSAIHARWVRDSMLRKSDGKATAPADAPADIHARSDAWRAYRQALRDITKQPGFPLNVEWPAIPD